MSPSYPQTGGPGGEAPGRRGGAMRRPGSKSTVFLAVALSATPFMGGSVVTGEGRPTDPDLPPHLQLADKAAFMRLRDENIALLRGMPHFLKYAPRVKALRERGGQERRAPQSDPAFWTQLGPAPSPNGQTVPPTSAVSGRTIA